MADIVLQKSMREGFGLTVTEALWKRRPVIGGETGGIVPAGGQRAHRLPGEHAGGRGAAHPLPPAQPAIAARWGENGHRHVRENFLLTRHLREYLTLMLALSESCGARLEVAA